MARGGGGTDSWETLGFPHPRSSSPHTPDNEGDTSAGTAAAGEFFGSPVEDEDTEGDKESGTGWKFSYNPSPEEKRVNKKEKLQTSKSFPIMEMLQYSLDSPSSRSFPQALAPPRIRTPVHR
eukprot:scaffold4564_cov369-Prasinococcus_capsulatus_cf.AAC.3